MEESLKFNSQICTTKEQSQRLLELGLKPETADMSHQYIEAEWDWFIFPCNWNSCMISEEHQPAWSLHRLIELLNPQTVEFAMSTVYGAYEDVIYNISISIKHGTFNKGYLKQ
ncbi:MAG: hypothetical protein J6B30_02350 [Muribaculaceae bacterium]|nr:hypothetical protein [Muribaculaceae bacterium]